MSVSFHEAEKHLMGVVTRLSSYRVTSFLDRLNLQAPPTCTYSLTVNKKPNALVGGPVYRGQLHPAGNIGLYIKK